MRRLIMIDELTSICGYYNGSVSVNNGYGCDHPECEDTEFDDEAGKEQGRCFTFSCPIAWQADLEDLQELDPGLAEEYKNDALPDGTIDSDWMVYDDCKPLPEGEGE
jgi:hypothetical protein